MSPTQGNLPTGEGFRLLSFSTLISIGFVTPNWRALDMCWKKVLDKPPGGDTLTRKQCCVYTRDFDSAPLLAVGDEQEEIF